MSRSRAKALTIISPSQHRQEEMLPMPCSVAAGIFFQLSTSNPATGRECRILRLWSPSCPSLPAHPGHNWTFFNPSPTSASTGYCSGASWAHLPGCKYWESSLSYLAKTTCTGAQKARVRASHCLPCFSGSPCHCPCCCLLLGLFPSRGARVLFALCCGWQHANGITVVAWWGVMYHH